MTAAAMRRSWSIGRAESNADVRPWLYQTKRIPGEHGPYPTVPKDQAAVLQRLANRAGLRLLAPARPALLVAAQPDGQGDGGIGGKAQGVARRQPQQLGLAGPDMALTRRQLGNSRAISATPRSWRRRTRTSGENPSTSGH